MSLRSGHSSQDVPEIRLFPVTMSMRSGCSSQGVPQIRPFPVRMSLRSVHSSQGVPEIRLFRSNFREIRPFPVKVSLRLGYASQSYPEIRPFPVKVTLRLGYASQSYPEIRPFPVVACTPFFSSVAFLSLRKRMRQTVDTDQGQYRMRSCRKRQARQRSTARNGGVKFRPSTTLCPKLPWRR